MDHLPLVTGRLALGAFRPSDAAAVHLACNDPEAQRWRAAPAGFDPAASVRFVNAVVPAGWAAGTDQHWAIRRIGAPGLIGVIGVATARGDVGYWLDARWRRRGFATEALAAVAAFRFAAGQAVLNWETLVGNVASARVAAAVGFRYLGEARHSAPGESERLTWWRAELRPADLGRASVGWPIGAVAIAV